MYIEKDVADNISNKTIIQQFQNMKNSYKEFLKPMYLWPFFFFGQYIQVLFLLNFV